MDPRFEELTDWIEEKWNAHAVIPEVLEHAPDLSVVDAYRTQAVRMNRLAAAGDRIIGYKAALTSKAMQEHVGRCGQENATGGRGRGPSGRGFGLRRPR